MQESKQDIIKFVTFEHMMEKSLSVTIPHQAKEFKQIYIENTSLNFKKKKSACAVATSRSFWKGLWNSKQKGAKACVGMVERRSS